MGREKIDICIMHKLYPPILRFEVIAIFQNWKSKGNVDLNIVIFFNILSSLHIMKLSKKNAAF